jgi:hypothetical protein
MSLTPVTVEDNHIFAASVTKPEHLGSGRNRFTDFLVTSTFPNAESLVRRRYEDFEWVQQRLVEERAGIIVPVLPTKKPTREEKFSEEFVEECRDISDRFLQRVIKHQELVDAPSLLAFFTASPADWKVAQEKARDLDAAEAVENSLRLQTTTEDPNSIVIDAEEQQGPKKKPGMFGKWISAKKDQWALRSKTLLLEETPAEAKKFQDLMDYANHLETCAMILSEDCKGLAEATKVQSEKYQTMGAAYTQLWGEHELSNTSSSTMYQTIGECWGGLCKELQEQHSFCKREFDASLEELVLDVVALKSALEKRKAVVYKYTKRFQQGINLQQQLDKMKATDDLNQHADKFHQLEKDAQVNHVQTTDGKKHCELVSLRLERDVERFRVEWHERMRQVLEKFHEAQVKFLQQQAKQFLKGLPALSAIDYSRANLPTVQKVVKPELKVSSSMTGTSVSFGESSQGSYPEKPVPIAGPPAAAPPPIPVSGSASFDSVGLAASFDSVGLAANETSAGPTIRSV